MLLQVTKDGTPVLQKMNWEMQPSGFCYLLVSLTGLSMITDKSKHLLSLGPT